jgi:hypothetical protein
MHDRRIGGLRESIAERDPLFPVVAADSHFDELVRRERAIDFRDQLRGDPGIANLHQRRERMRAGLQMRTLTRGEGGGHPSIVLTGRPKGLRCGCGTAATRSSVSEIIAV